MTVREDHDVEDAMEMQPPQAARLSQGALSNDSEESREDSMTSSVDEEETKKAELRNHERFYGTRKCWARYCWADRNDPASHSHPVETLSSNRLKLMGKGEADHFVIQTGFRFTIIRFARYNGERLYRQLNFYGPIYRKIEGYYGSGVAGYVGLINRLFLLSIYTFLLLGGLFVLPSVISFNRYQAKIKAYAADLNINPTSVEEDILKTFALDPFFMLNDTDVLYLSQHRDISQPSLSSQANASIAAKVATSFLELLEGTGWMENTWFFLGQYADRTNLTLKSTFIGRNKLNMDPFPYTLPMAFLSAIFGVFIVSLFVLISGSGSSLKENLKGQHSRAYPFCEVLFGTWPHSLQVKSGVENQKLTETSQLKILLTGSKKKAPQQKTLQQVALLILIRGAVWLAVAGFLAAFGYLLYMAVTEWVPKGITYTDNQLQKAAESTVALLEFQRLVFNFIPSLLITGFNFIVPTLLGVVAKFEAYSNVKTELRITLVRTVLLRLASVGFLLFSIFLQLGNGQSGTLLGTNKTILFTVRNTTEIPCFETYAGQQIYKVLILDVLVSIGLFIGLQIPMKLLYRTTNIAWLKAKVKQEFNLPGNILSIIYIQCLYWLGMFYAPLLSGMAILHFLLKAVIGQLGIFFIFEPPSKIHHSSGSDVFFTVVALLAFFLALFVVGIAAITVKPSTVCGPFIFMKEYSTMYDYFMGTLGQSAGNFRFLIEMGSSTVILLPITIFIAVILYYKTATASAKATGIKILKKKIEDATGLKKFLEKKARQSRR